MWWCLAAWAASAPAPAAPNEDPAVEVGPALGALGAAESVVVVVLVVVVVVLELVVVLAVVVFGVAVVLVGVESLAQGAAPASALLPGVVVAGLVVPPLVSVLVESVAGLVVVVSVL